ncbi:hypothetical protein [Stakelama saccharophila]|uniref:Uncharacterized protein n=1 Tax=Stakelama saccharophila TaxID=3075605 RepID=A0ABZ0BBT2_9SPHN|nr:hypothetical protein [Stakelama sp. W311]WNO54526.1 hypothetical protein RPR59_04525 [Stakelama sp. W311]
MIYQILISILLALTGCSGTGNAGESPGAGDVIVPNPPVPTPTPAPPKDRPTAAFHMPAIAAPQISDNVAFESLGPWTLDAGDHEQGERRLENNYLFLKGGDAADFHLHDIEARNHGPLLRGSHMPGVVVERIAVTDGRRSPTYGIGIATLSNGIGHAVFRDLSYIGDLSSPADNSNDAWAAIALKGKNANDTGTFVIDRFDFRNLFMAEGDNYRNADGISVERGYSGTITNGRVMNASDACLDIKGDVRIDNVQIAGCREGLKAWSDQHHGVMEIGTNEIAAIIGKGTSAGPRTMTIDVLIVDGNPKVPLFRAEDGVFNLRIGTLIAAPNQVIRDKDSYPHSRVDIGKRIRVR